MTPSLRQFMFISIVGMTVLLLSLLYFHIDLSREYLQGHLDTQNRNLAIVLRNSLLADGIDKVLISRKSKLNESMLEKISATLQRELRWLPVVKIKIYDMDSSVLFSTKNDEIGVSASDNEAVRVALSGAEISGMVEADHVNEFDNLIEVDNVHQLYIPIRDTRNHSVIGVFEIYTDITRLLDKADAKQKQVFWSIAIILAIFYMALAYSFLNIHRLLRKESSQRQTHLNDLQVIQSDLEHRVEERTSELDRSRQFLQSIMDNVPDAIFTCNSKFRIQSVNPSALTLFNAQESDLIGQDFNSFFTDKLDIGELRPGETVENLSQLKQVGGLEIPADVWIGLLNLQDEASHYIAVVRDISFQVKAQRELDSTRQQYFHQEKMAAIGHLAAGILHEVGNPIAAIAGAASELKMVAGSNQSQLAEKSFDDDMSENVELIDEQTTRLAKITREIADFASPKIRERELLDLNGLLQSTTRLLKYDRRFNDVSLQLELDKSLPAVVGVADQLTQIFMNLLINAMDASRSLEQEKNSILIRSSIDDDMVHVSVQDFGGGMSKDTLDHVIEPFYTTKAVGKGTGLGLSLCNTLILGHGGRWHIDSEEGSGTTVHVYLPLDLDDDQHNGNEQV